MKENFQLVHLYIDISNLVVLNPESFVNHHWPSLLDVEKVDNQEEAYFSSPGEVEWHFHKKISGGNIGQENTLSPGIKFIVLKSA